MTQPKIFIPELWAKKFLKELKTSNSLLNRLNRADCDCNYMGKMFIDYLDPTLSAWLRLISARVVLAGMYMDGRSEGYSVRWRDKTFPLTGEPRSGTWDLQVGGIMETIKAELAKESPPSYDGDEI